MSMMEALRVAGHRIVQAVDTTKPEKLDPLAEHAELVRLASHQGAVDLQSGTWMAVSGWAAREILEARSKLEGATDAQAAGLKARIKAMRDLLSSDDRQRRTRRIEVKSESPDIP